MLESDCINTLALELFMHPVHIIHPIGHLHGQVIDLLEEQSVLCL